MMEKQTKITTSTMVSLIATMTLLKLAEVLTPITRRW